MGICSHSSPEFWDEFVIFAVGDDDAVLSNFKEFCKDHNIGFKQMQGAWRGNVETSFIVNKRNLSCIKEHGWLSEQESILHLSGMQRLGARHAFCRVATLEWIDTGQIDLLGWFMQCNRDEALGKQGYTYDPADDSYWITCKERM